MKIKKTLAALASAITVASGASVFSASVAAAPPPSTSPRVYVDFVYEDDGDIRADIICENMPNIYAASFRVDFGSGWTVEPSVNHPESGYVRYYSDFYMSPPSFLDSDTVLVIFAPGYAPNINGVFLSIYVDRAAGNNPLNSYANISFGGSDGFYTQSSTVNTTLPTMNSSYEYMIGDTNGNNIFNAVDASNVLWFVNHYGSKSVYQVQNNLSTYFPNAVCAAAADANEDGYITNTDADVILDAYAKEAANHPITSNVGKYAIDEIFN